MPGGNVGSGVIVDMSRGFSDLVDRSQRTHSHRVPASRRLGHLPTAANATGGRDSFVAGAFGEEWRHRSGLPQHRGAPGGEFGSLGIDDQVRGIRGSCRRGRRCRRCPPGIPLPAPRGINARCDSAASRTTATTSSRFLGIATARARYDRSRRLRTYAAGHEDRDNTLQTLTRANRNVKLRLRWLLYTPRRPPPLLRHPCSADPYRVDRRLGHEWDEWNGRRCPGAAIFGGPGPVFRFAALTLAALAAAAAFLLYLVGPRSPRSRRR